MNILLYDIETSPNVAYTWGKYDQNVPEFIQESYMLCYSYRWLGDKSTKVAALPDFDLYKKQPTNDKALVQSLWELFNKADVIIAHNGDAFDIKYSNGRFLTHGLPPPTTYRTIDTLKIARNRFKLNSNKLDDLGQALNLGRKLETGGFGLWVGCMNGDEKSWKLMKKYNKQDVDLLLDVYLTLRPWAKNHPNLNIMFDTDRQCPVCHSHKVQKAGFEFLNGNRRQRWKCQSCGANSYTSLTKEQPLKAA